MAVILYLIAFGIYLLYKWSISTFDYFEKQGIPFRKPWPLLGTNTNMITRKYAFNEAIQLTYSEFKNHK